MQGKINITPLFMVAIRTSVTNETWTPILKSVSATLGKAITNRTKLVVTGDITTQFLVVRINQSGVWAQGPAEYGRKVMSHNVR